MTWEHDDDEIDDDNIIIGKPRRKNQKKIEIEDAFPILKNMNVNIDPDAKKRIPRRILLTPLRDFTTYEKFYQEADHVDDLIFNKKHVVVNRDPTRSGKTHATGMVSQIVGRMWIGLPEIQHCDDFMKTHEEIICKLNESRNLGIKNKFLYIHSRTDEIYGCTDEIAKKLPGYLARFACEDCENGEDKCIHYFDLRNARENDVSVVSTQSMLATPLFAAANEKNKIDLVVLDESPIEMFIKSIVVFDSLLEKFFDFIEKHDDGNKSVLKRAREIFSNETKHIDADDSIHVDDFLRNITRLKIMSVIQDEEFKINPLCEYIQYFQHEMKVRHIKVHGTGWYKITIKIASLIDTLQLIPKILINDAQALVKMIGNVFHENMDEIDDEIDNKFDIYQRSDKPFGMSGLVKNQLLTAEIIDAIIEIIQSALEHEKILIVCRKDIQKLLVKPFKRAGIKFDRCKNTMQRRKFVTSHNVVIDAFPLKSTSLYEKFNIVIIFGAPFIPEDVLTDQAEILEITIDECRKIHEVADIVQAIGRLLEKRAYVFTDVRLPFKNIHDITEGVDSSMMISYRSRDDREKEKIVNDVRNNWIRLSNAKQNKNKYRLIQELIDANVLETITDENRLKWIDLGINAAALYPLIIYNRGFSAATDFSMDDIQDENAIDVAAIKREDEASWLIDDVDDPIILTDFKKTDHDFVDDNFDALGFDDEYFNNLKLKRGNGWKKYNEKHEKSEKNDDE